LGGGRGGGWLLWRLDVLDWTGLSGYVRFDIDTLVFFFLVLLLDCCYGLCCMFMT
jgi:hypothetical protein